jgi:hypothetical protein
MAIGQFVDWELVSQISDAMAGLPKWARAYGNFVAAFVVLHQRAPQGDGPQTNCEGTRPPAMAAEVTNRQQVGGGSRVCLQIRRVTEECVG